MDFREQIIDLLVKETKLSSSDVDHMLSVPPNPAMGDYAFPCFRFGKNPKEAAEKLQKQIKRPHFLLKIEVAGPYLNFFLHPLLLVESTLTAIISEREEYGHQDLGTGKKIVVDFSSPNIAKPFGIGHLRSTVIGNSLCKIYRFLGYEVIGINHLGDWGTQFGKLIVAYHKWGKEKELKKEPIKHLLKLYVKFHEEAERDGSLDDQARLEFKKLEDGDKQSLALWKVFKDLSLTEFQRIYGLLNVSFDSLNGEAFYNTVIEGTLKELQKAVPTEMSEGALIVNLKKYNLPPLLLRKSNESTTYHTRDIAAALYRLRTYHPEKVIYVVGSEQKLHFQQLFTVLKLGGWNNDNFVHVDFGLFRFPEGKMSTRKGRVIFLEDVLEKAISQAEKIIEEKNPSLANKKEVAKVVGVGAIIFGDLSSDRIRDVDFDWNRMLSFEGETGPYLQYTHARACSILRKAGLKKKKSAKISFKLLSSAQELALVKDLSLFPNILVTAAQTYKPHHLAQYLIRLAQKFNDFYHSCQVISEDKELMNARCALVDAVRQVLANGLSCLGIEALEEM